MSHRAAQPPSLTGASDPALNYHAMRMRWSKGVLLALIRRWRGYLLTGGVVLCASANGAYAALASMAATTVLPLFHATQSPGWMAGLVCVAHGLVGAMLLLALRPVLWNTQWADVERALPVRLAQRAASDAVMTVMSMTPLFSVYVVGAIIWLNRNPRWLQGRSLEAVALLCCSVAMTVCAGVIMLARWRGMTHTASVRYARSGKVTAIFGSSRRDCSPMSPTMALVILPMLRKPRQRVGWLFTGGCMALLLIDLAMAMSQEATAWWLAMLSAVLLVVISRLHSLAESDLRPLHESSGQLPFSAGLDALRWCRWVLAFAPAILGVLGLAAVALVLPLRPILLTVYILVALGGSMAQIALQSESASTRASRWLLTLVMLLAIGSEMRA